MSPTVTEASTRDYKTPVPSARGLLAQFSPSCATLRAPSPPESVSSDKSCHSCSTDSSTLTSKGSGVGIATGTDPRKRITEREKLARPELIHQRFVDRQEENYRHTGTTGSYNDVTDRLPTCFDQSSLADHEKDGNSIVSANCNNNSNIDGGGYYSSIQQESSFSSIGLPSLHNAASDQRTSYSPLVDRPLRPASGTVTLPPYYLYEHIASSPAVGSTIPTSSANRGYGNPFSSSDSDVNKYVQSRYPPKKKMAAEGDTEEASARKEHSLKPKRKVTLDPNHVSHQFFHLEPCLYSHRMFIRAAQIFSVLKQDDADTEENKAMRRRQGPGVVRSVDKGTIPEMDFIDAHEQIKTFELTFATLKFQKLFSSILDYTGFFHEYCDLRRVHSLCYVILYDLQTRKFQRRIPFTDEILDSDCVEVENALLAQKTKLQANIAKERVKNHAPSIEFLLPEHIRNKDETKTKTPVYVWVNQFKITVEEAIENLKSQGFQEMFGQDMSERTGSIFSVDPHCSDLLTFPAGMDMEVRSWDSVTCGELVQQDKSSCLAPQSVPLLLGPDHDVIHVNVGTAITTSHLASLLRNKCPNSHIFAFGVDTMERARKVAKNFELLGVKSVRVIHDEFLSVDPEDPRFKAVRVILISANCSKSAITSPVQFIVSEGEDTQILGKLSVGDTDMTMVGELMGEHERLLKHALRFPKLQAVVYTTRSRHEAENEVVVTKVLEFFNMTNGKKPLFKVVPPVIPFCADEINSDIKNGVDGRYIRFRPSDRANGCFVAVIAKEPEDPRESRTNAGKSKSKAGLNKTRSASSGVHEDGADDEVSSGKPNGKGNRKSVKSGGSSTDAKTTGSSNSLKSKLSQHKSPAAVGARLYQAGLIKKMENGGAKTQAAKPEHLKVVKHPAPFRESDAEASSGN